MNERVEAHGLIAAPKVYAWSQYLDCMEGVPLDVVHLSSTKPKTTPIWGLLFCLFLTVVAMLANNLPVWPFTLAGGRHPLEPVMLSIVLGLVWSNVCPLPKWVLPGIKFSVKKLLPLGIILLGARLDFVAIMKLGGVGIAMSLFEIVLALTLMWGFTRWLKLSGKLGTLLGIGTAICGGTAIVATAPVIEAEEGDVVFGVATVTLLGLDRHVFAAGARSHDGIDGTSLWHLGRFGYSSDTASGCRGICLWPASGGNGDHHQNVARMHAGTSGVPDRVDLRA